MFIESWDDFAQRARHMYQEDPVNTRYVTRYNHAKATLTVKITDNTKCWQFKTDQQADEKKVDELNRFFIQTMAGMDSEAMLESATVLEAAPPSGGKKRSTKRKN